MTRDSYRHTNHSRMIIWLLGGLVIRATIGWPASSETPSPETTKTEVTKLVDTVVHETNRYDPELAQEIKRQEHLVMREMRGGDIRDERVIQAIEMYREVQRELSARVAQVADGPVHFEQVYKDMLTRNPQEAEQMKATLQQVSHGEVVHPTTPEMMDRLLIETKRFVTENPEVASYAREFTHRELERYQREQDAHTSPHNSDAPSLKHERGLSREHRSQDAVTPYDLQHSPTVFTSLGELKHPSGVERLHETSGHDVERGREVSTREIERVREAPVREVERVREAPIREVERVREVPVREVERVREAPVREVERVREAPKVEHRVESLSQNSRDQHREHQQKTEQKRH